VGAVDATDEPGMRDRAILELLFSTGLRVSELIALNRDQVNLESREFSVIGKGRKVRVVFVTDAAAEAISAYLSMRKDRFKPLFIRYRGHAAEQETPGGRAAMDGEAWRLRPRSVERMMAKYVRLAGLDIKATPHTLRHSFATDLLFNGADLRSLQEMLGHASLATTEIYTHVTNAQLRAVHRDFHSGNRRSVLPLVRGSWRPGEPLPVAVTATSGEQVVCGSIDGFGGWKAADWARLWCEN
jgi:site-specific recombinase XerD